jgi:hypothetical protein
MVAINESETEQEIRQEDVIWFPFEGSQRYFLSCPIFECLYEGTRGPGKSDCLLMDFYCNYVNKGFGSDATGIIFRKTFPDLEELIKKSFKWFSQIPGASYNKSEHRWTFGGGEELAFRYAATPDDYWNYHGHEYPFVGWDELTSWPSDELYLALMSICRSSNPNVPRHYRATCNPYGVGHNWVKMRFIDVAPRGVVTTGEQGLERVAIHGDISENPAILTDPNYLNILNSTEGAKGKAWRKGDWDIIAGGMFDDVWDAKIHIVEPFTIPSTWRIDRSFDWGSSHPYAVCFWAESDGSDIKLNDGTLVSTQKDSLYLIAEIYGWTGKANEGTKEVATEIARKIKAFELQLKRNVYAGPADSSIFDVQNGNSYAADMERIGVAWTRADKSPGSRINGWELMRQRLKNSMTKEGPGLYVFNTCRQFLRTVPVLPRNESKMEDVDSESEDHIGDATRYRLSAKTYKFKCR